MNKNYSYIISAIAVILTSVLGSTWTANSARSEWYKCIKPRAITPPNFIFPIVWTILYFTLFLGLARALHKNYVLIYVLLFTTLILNVIWCYYYFNQREIKIAFIILIALIILAIMIIALSFYKKDSHLANLIIPYLLWISYASVLNYFSMSKLNICSDLKI
jgi:tryptophan-rich sensory protein